jgi:2-alkenal reductase
LLLSVVVAVVVGFGAGLGGGMLATRTTPPTPVATAAPTTQDAIHGAVDRALPNVVLVLADGPDVENIGSGVVVSQSGHILTAAHVIHGATKFTVYLPDGQPRPARLLDDDSPFTDSAVLLIDPQGLRPIAFGASAALRPGDIVLSISGGTGQFGPGNTVALGVVSATGRTLPRSGVTFEDMIQTDAAINSGDSGGPLINLAGELIGLTTTVIRQGPGGSEVRDIGFAQSADSLRPIIAGVIATGAYPRPRIGIERPDEQHTEIDPQLAADRRLPVQEGALIVAPRPGSPAARAGIVAGDIIVGVNGQPVTYSVPMVNLLKRLPRGTRIDLAVLRGGRTVTVQVTPEE